MIDQESLFTLTARALADAVTQTEATCQSNGGEDTQACGFAQAEVRDIARAQVCLFAGDNQHRRCSTVEHLLVYPADRRQYT